MSSELRSLFEQSEQGIRVTNYARTTALAIIFMMAGVVLDLGVFPELAWEFFIARALSALFLAWLLWIIHRRQQTRWSPLLPHLVAVPPLVSMLWMIWRTGGSSSPYYAGISLIFVAASLLMRWSTRDGVYNATLCFSSYLFVVLALCPVSSWAHVINNGYFLFVTAFFSCAGTYFYNHLRYKEFSLRAQLVESRSDLEENHRKLQALDEAKTRFFANVSHELRTPLTLILGPLESLKREPAITRDARNVELLAMLEDNGLRLLRLINDLLDLVRLDSGVMPDRIERVDLRRFIDAMTASLRATAETKQVSFIGKCETLGDDWCWMDRDKVEKILLNLSINAIKFTPLGGRIELRAILTSDSLRLVVSDTGVGIKLDEMPFVFERFWQADMSSKRKHGGVGIGLAMVKSFVDSLAGEINIASVVGQGTTFTVTLPLSRRAEASSDEEASPPPLDPVEILHQRARLSGVSDGDDHRAYAFNKDFPVSAGSGNAQDGPLILVADDEPALRRYLAQTMRPHRVIEAKDGLEAWELARQYSPELIVLDLMMPGLDGIETTRRLRGHAATSHTPIVLVTANAEDSPRLDALEAGVSDFVTKPFSTVELTTRIRNLLAQRRYERDLAASKRALEIAHEDLKENEARLVQAESLSALGTMAAGIIHEINNPLNYASTALHTLKTFTSSLPEDEKADYDEIVADAIDGVQRVIRIVSDLRSFTSGTAGRAEKAELSEVIEAARRLVSKDLQGIEVKIQVPRPATVMGSANQLTQVFQNLIQNAASFVLAAAKRGERPTIEIRGEVSAGGSVTAVVRDNGSGIKPEDLPRIFAPFFTKRDVGQGMGLGLSICHQILTAHRAQVSVASEVDAYTEFSICFPPPDTYFEFDVSRRVISLNSSH